MWTIYHELNQIMSSLNHCLLTCKLCGVRGCGQQLTLRLVEDDKDSMIEHYGISMGVETECTDEDMKELSREPPM